MKKICLLAAAASVFAMNTQAADWSMGNRYFRPYIGADYVYSYAKHGGMASDAKRDYNSWMVNVGTDIAEYTSIEAFFQQAPQRKTTGLPKNSNPNFMLTVWTCTAVCRLPAPDLTRWHRSA